MKWDVRLAEPNFLRKLVQNLKRFPHKVSVDPSLYDNVDAFSHMRQKVDGLFDGITVDEAKLARLRATPWPDRRYVLFSRPGPAAAGWVI
jgi:hypothetical protein